MLGKEIWKKRLTTFFPKERYRIFVTIVFCFALTHGFCKNFSQSYSLNLSTQFKGIKTNTKA